MEDEKILHLYNTRDEQAIAHTALRYGGYCGKVALSILQNPQDVEEVLSDTWLRAWNSIPPQQPKSLKLYLARITRNLALNVLRDKDTAKRGRGMVEVALEELGDCVGKTLDHHFEEQELTKTIEQFLETLPARERMVFVRRYFFLEDIPEIAQRYGLKDGNTRVILSRTRRKLKTYLIKEGYEL